MGLTAAQAKGLIIATTLVPVLVACWAVTKPASSQIRQQSAAGNKRAEVTLVAQEFLAGRCYGTTGAEPAVGYLPSLAPVGARSCIQGRQWTGHIAVLDGRVVITNVFSNKEVQVAIDTLLISAKEKKTRAN